MLLFLGAFYGLIASYQVLECGEHTTVATGYMLVCIYLACIAPIGMYGASRVVADVEDEIGDLEVVDAKKKRDAKAAQSGEDETAPDVETVTTGEGDDGVGTSGQGLIAIFFVCSLFGTCLWLILAVEAFVLADDSMMHGATCGHQASLMSSLGWIGVIGTALLVGGSRYVGKVVTGFYLVRTLVQILNIMLMLLGAMLFVGCMGLVKQMVCLSPDGDLSGSLIIFVIMGLFGYSLGMLSIAGHFAASRESRPMLNNHVKSLSVWLVLCFIFGFTILFTGVDQFVGFHCLELLNALPMSYFEDALQCPKYRGQGQTWNGTGYDTTYDGPAEIATCRAKRKIRFAWEVNPVQRIGGGEVNHFGCINTDCCNRIDQVVQGWEFSIVLTLILIYMFVFSTVWMDFKLMSQASRKGHTSLVRRRESQVMWAGRGLMLLMAILVPALTWTTSCMEASTHENSANLQATIGVQSSISVRPSSCYNGILDGIETDIDCGGSCSSRCILSQGCAGDDDCTPPMHCLEVEAITEQCFDLRCIEGQADRATGTCGFPGPDVTCYDNVQGQRETCIDGGGPACRSLGKTCETTCVVDEDCNWPMQCADYRCVACQSGAQDNDETDVDCGGPTCSPCADQLSCMMGNDCRSGLCWDTVCVSHSNGITDGNETCVDGGGGAPRRCQLGASCIVDSDCASGLCTNTSQVCAEPDPTLQCRNGQLDGLETCVDAGGAICRSIGLACDVGDGCEEDNDCIGGNCYENICASCYNGIVDGDEGDVDCGVTCGPCPDGRSCTTDEQCLRNSYCYVNSTDSGGRGVCASAYNGIQDADETCIDGGGHGGALYLRPCQIGETCLTFSDCISGNCGAEGVCIVDDLRQACNDGALNGWETDIDCGGDSCRSIGRFCADNAACTIDADCEHSLCAWGRCVSCSNDIYDGYETDVDCGGTCEACVDGRACLVGSDCASGSCESAYIGSGLRVCTSCFNGVQDGEELDIDCGGNCARRCPLGARCLRNADCATSYCNTDFSMCATAPTVSNEVIEACSNGLRDAGEAAADCGESCAAAGLLCPSGSTCSVPGDCDSFFCDGLFRCISCFDGVLNGEETDIDCGGSQCGSCTDGHRCLVNDDCNSDYCAGSTGHRVCASCLNGVQDGTETDVDCGADCPAQCADNARCVSDRDCISAHCNSGVCSIVDPAASCENSYRSEHETCVDGGGPQCNALGQHCPLGADCRTDNDCDSGNCYDGTCISCNDDEKNGDETDTDCGGARCAECSDGAACLLLSDCINRACYVASDTNPDPDGHRMLGVCVSHDNGIQDGDETCVDAGGPTSSAQCPNGDGCLDDSDCISGSCVGSVCQEQHPDITCSDAAQGQLETDIDCGGEVCRSRGHVCDAGQTCVEDADCRTGAACRVDTSVCADLDCLDGVRWNDESDVDCGGSCDPCVAGRICRSDSDCLSSDVCIDAPSLNETRCAEIAPLVFAVPQAASDSVGATDTSPTVLNIASGEIVMHSLLIEASEPYVGDQAGGSGVLCNIVANMRITGGTSLSFPAASGDIYGYFGYSEICRQQTNIMFDADNDVTLSGPASCVAALIDKYEVDSTCASPWQAGDAFGQSSDLVNASLTVTILETDSLCTMPSPSQIELNIRLVGRPELRHEGTLVRARSYRQIPSETVYGVEGVELSGFDGSCVAYMNSLSPCERGCCDTFPAWATEPPLSCAQLFSYGFSCDVVGVMGTSFVDVGLICPESCGRCPPPLPPNAISTFSQAGAQAGGFSLDIPFTATAHASGPGSDTNHQMTLEVVPSQGSGYKQTIARTPMGDRTLRMGAIPLAMAGNRRGSVQGRCVPPSIWADDASLLRGTVDAVARLRAGVVVYPAAAEIVEETDVDFADGGSFEFEDLEAGTYTVECVDTTADATSGPERAVVVEGTIRAELPQVLLLPAQSFASPSGLTIVISWDEYGDAAESALDSHLVFRATEAGQRCHVFYGAPECGGVASLMDGPVMAGEPEDKLTWLDEAWSTVGASRPKFAQPRKAQLTLAVRDRTMLGRRWCRSTPCFRPCTRCTFRSTPEKCPPRVGLSPCGPRYVETRHLPGLKSRRQLARLRRYSTLAARSGRRWARSRCRSRAPPRTPAAICRCCASTRGWARPLSQAARCERAALSCSFESFLHRAPGLAGGVDLTAG